MNIFKKTFLAILLGISCTPTSLHSHSDSTIMNSYVGGLSLLLVSYWLKPVSSNSTIPHVEPISLATNANKKAFYKYGRLASLLVGAHLVAQAEMDLSVKLAHILGFTFLAELVKSTVFEKDLNFEEYFTHIVMTCATGLSSMLLWESLKTPYHRY